MMTRRAILFACASLIASPRPLWAQSAKGLPRVAMLYPGSPVQRNELAQAFLHAMRENGYVDGRDFAFDLRYVGTSAGELDRALGDLLPLAPAVIVTIGSPGAWAAKKATSTIPIVMATVGDPVGQGLVASLARPGGNLTGNAILADEVVVKRLELLHEVLPTARRISVLDNRSNPAQEIAWIRLEAAAKQLGVTLRRFDAPSTSVVAAVLEEIARQRPDALMVSQDNVTFLARSTIVSAISRYRIPAVHPFKEDVVEGGLMSYANSTEAMFRRAAVFVVRILKGARPSELPVEQATKFELFINLKTAKALGLTIPPSLLVRADQVIE